MTLKNPLAYTASKPKKFEDYQAMVNAISDAVANDSDVTTDTAYDVAVGTAAPVIIEFTVTKTTA